MRTSVQRAGWAAALLAGLLLRIFFVLHHARFLGDPLVYGDLAHNMLAHHVYGLTEDHVRSTLIRLPGYPLFLALCFAVFGDGNYLAVLWVQVVFDLGTCVLLGLLARRLFGARAGLMAVWLSALCPFTANYSAAALAETLSIGCVALALWALAGWVARLHQGPSTLPMVLTMGVALTGAALLRPDGVLLAAAVLPAMIVAAFGLQFSRYSRGIAGAVVAGGMLCAALGVWAARNWHVFHVVQPLAPKYANDPDEMAPLGFARWYRTWAIGFGDSVNVYWTYDGSALQMSDLPPRAFDDEAQRAETARIFARYNEQQAASPAVDEAFAMLAAERVRAHPVRYYVLLPIAKLADMSLRPRTELMKMPVDWWNVRAHPGRSAFEMAYAGWNVVLLGLAGVGWVRWRRLRWSGYGPVALACVLFVGLRCAMLLTIDNSEPRYTLECYPVVLLLASLALTRGGSCSREQNTGVSPLRGR